MMVILYGYWRSSAAYRVRIALNLKGITYEQRSLTLSSGDQRGSEYVKINPQGRVPALVDGATVLTQSQAIIEYLDERYPEPPMLPGDVVARARVRAIAAGIACDIHPLNNLMVLNHLRDSLGRSEDEVNVWYRHWIAAGLEGVEGLLANNDNTGRYCHGDSPSMADAFLIPQVYNAHRYACPLDPFPTIARIEAACLELEPFIQAMPERQPDAT